MILVTGASGFVGGHITRRLSESGETVRALYHRREPDERLRAWRGVTWQQADLLDVYDAEAAMEGITEVYHCAAIVSFDPARRAEIIHTNIELACNVVNAALEAGMRKLVHISSVAALGRNGTTKEITEEAQWEESKLNSGYAVSKYGAEMEVWRGIGEGLDAAIVNPGIILGEPLMRDGWKGGSANLMRVAYNEFPFFTNGITSFVDIADVVKAVVGLMHSEASAGRYILSAGNFPFREIFTRMADALNKKRPRIRAGALATGVVWRWSALKGKISGTTPTITKETAKNAQLKSFYKSDKITEALPGFAYTPIGNTVTRMAKAFLAEYVA